MRNQQNETGQISLFAQESYGPPALILGRIVQLSGPQREGGRLENNLKGFRSLSRLTDPKTSRNAAEKTSQFRTRHIAKIWTCLKDFGPMTYKEIAKKVGMEPVAVARRRKEMEESGLIDVLGEIRNGCSVWSAK
jgi:CRP-like cAMP-binding protein